MDLIEVKTAGVFVVDMMYASDANMMQTDVYGKVGLGNRCFVHPDVWMRLQKLEPVLQQKGLKLKICDAYRPPLAFHIMKEIIPMAGFFAAEPVKSQHCHASAIDVTLLDENGEELAFPCAVDAYEPRYAAEIAAGEWDDFRRHLEKAKYSWNAPEDGDKIANRDMFRRMMEEAGFQALEHEWWHYNLPDKEKYPMVDFKVNPDGSCSFTAVS